MLFPPKHASLSLVLLAALGCNRTAPTTAPQTKAVEQPSSTALPPDNLPRVAEESGGGRPRRGRPLEQAQTGQFDFYLFNLSWSPEFCATHSDSPECGHQLGFVVHGLWPQNNTGDYPENCSNAPGPTNPQADTDIIPTVSLVQHEWQTHGTCSGLAADAYFTEIHKAFAAVKIPSNIGEGNDAGGVTPNDLLGRFTAANPGYPAASFALSCGNNRLTAVEICLTKDLQPEACQSVRSCRANVVKITPK